MSESSARHVSDSETEQVQIVFSAHLNSQSRLFGGQLASWIDIVAGLVARRHCHHAVTTAEIDTLRFKAPVYEGSILILRGKITCVGHTSMEVRVDSYVESLTGERTLVNTAYLVEVALDENGRPVEVPRLVLDTPEERLEWEAGEKRRLLRKQRQTEDF